MKRSSLAILLAAAAVTCSGVFGTASGGTQRQKETGAARFPVADRRFEALADRYLEGDFAYRPSWATFMGNHKYDDRLPDRSRAAIDAEVARLRSTIAELDRIDPRGLGPVNRIDYDLLRHDAEGKLFDLTEVRRWETDPGSYNYGDAIQSLTARSFAPPEERLRVVIARLGQVPRLLASARENLSHPPRLFSEFAIEDFEGLLSFLDRDVPAALSAVKDSALWARYSQAKTRAADSTRSFVEWVRKDLVPRSDGTFVLGADRYAKKLHYEEMIDTPLDTLLAIGARELDRLEARYEKTAKEIDPGASLEQINETMRRDHPAADSLIPYAQGLLEDLRSYCIRSKFIEIPSEIRCRVRPTPEFEASRSFASLDPPGPFETKANEAYYAITLPGASWDSARVEQHLQGYSRWTLPSVSAHEAYPGHFVHFLWAKRAPTQVRKALGCGSFAEGWGLYCEEALFDHGYRREDPRARFGMLRWALVRSCRLQAGIRVHTKGMSIEEATQYFVDHAHMERANAAREAYRAAFDPTYIVYTVGAMQIRKMRADLERREGAKFDLARFHASMLSQGALPVALLRQLLLHDDGPTL
jgi:uncharacterized protein (DUF885 family)